MTDTTTPVAPTASAERGEFRFSRTYNAPASLVYRCYTEPALLAQWYAPAGMTVPLDTVVLELVPGGRFEAVMVMDSTSNACSVNADTQGQQQQQQQQQQRYPFACKFESITPNQELKWVEPKLDMHGTVTFTEEEEEEEKEQGGKRTRVDTVHTNAPEPYRGKMAEMGCASAAANLEALLAKLQQEAAAAGENSNVDSKRVKVDEEEKDSKDQPRGEFRMVRTYDAPVDKVFRCYTEPQLLAQWFAPPGVAIPVETVVLEPVVGGKMNLVMVIKDGDEEKRYPNEGRFISITPNKEIVWEEPAHQITTRVTFSESTNPKTQTTVALHQQNVPPMFLGPQAEKGFSDAAEQLKALLETL